MKKWLLNTWHKIMQRYSRYEINLLKKDLEEIHFECKFYRKLYNSLLLLWLSYEKPDTKIVGETQGCTILQIKLGDKFIQLPITEYKSILDNFMELEKQKGVKLTSFEINVNRFCKYMSGKVLENYD